MPPPSAKRPNPFQLALERSGAFESNSREWQAFSKSTIDLVEGLSRDIKKLDVSAQLLGRKGATTFTALISAKDEKGRLVFTVERIVNTKTRSIKTSVTIIGENYAELDIGNKVNAFDRKLSVAFRAKTITATAAGDNAFYSALRRGMLPKDVVRLDTLISNNVGTLTEAQVKKWFSLSKDKKKDFVLSDEFKPYKAAFAGRTGQVELDLASTRARKAYFAAYELAPRTLKERTELRESVLLAAREDSRAEAIGNAIIRRRNDPIRRQSRPFIAAVRDNYISYGLDLQAFEENTARKIAAYLENAEAQIVGNILDTDPARPGRTSGTKKARLGALLFTTTATLLDTFDVVNSLLLLDLSQLAQTESEFDLAGINAPLGIDLLSTALTPTQADAIASDIIIDGAPHGDWWMRQSNKTRNRFADTMRVGLAQGETTPELVRRVRGTPTGRRVPYRAKDGTMKMKPEYTGGVLTATKRESQALVRTSVNAVSNRARLATFEENSDVIHGVQILSTLDSRTTPICQNYSGKAWRLDDKSPIDHFDGWPGPPPYHWQCRTTLISILKSFEELAPAKQKDLAKQVDERAKEIAKSATQASEFGQVDANLNYKMWLDSLPVKKQKEILGASRHKLWKDGEIVVCAPPVLR